MVETSTIEEDVAARPTERPLLRRLRDLVSRLYAARQASRLETIERIRRSGLAHID